MHNRLLRRLFVHLSICLCLLVAPAVALGGSTPRAGLGLVTGPLYSVGLGGSIWLAPNLTFDVDTTTFAFLFINIDFFQAGMSLRAPFVQNAHARHELVCRASVGAARTKIAFEKDSIWSVTYGANAGCGYVGRRFEWSATLGPQSVVGNDRVWVPNWRLSFMYLFG